jgi:hypothetical protein
MDVANQTPIPTGSSALVVSEKKHGARAIASSLFLVPAACVPEDCGVAICRAQLGIFGHSAVLRRISAGQKSFFRERHDSCRQVSGDSRDKVSVLVG